MSNPRGTTPNLDPRLGPNYSPGGSLVEDMGGLVDEMRQLVTDFGLRPYEVWSVVVGWSGGERHRGEARVVWEERFLPTPKIEGIASIAREVRSAGDVQRGTVKLTQLSPRYTEEQIETLFPRALRAGEEHFVEVRMDSRDGETTRRRRYVVSATPERRPDRFDWEVQLTKQDEDRTASGRPR